MHKWREKFVSERKSEKIKGVRIICMQLFSVTEFPHVILVKEKNNLSLNDIFIILLDTTFVVIIIINYDSVYRQILQC